MTTIVYEDAIARLIKSDRCCPSCHEDANEYGYDLMEIELGKNRTAYVCCDIFNAFEDWCEKKPTSGGGGNR